MSIEAAGRRVCCPIDTLANMIFIIEDDEAVRLSLIFLLESAGWQVRPFASANAFLDGASPSNADCLITDIHMPGISGLDLVRQIRKSGSQMPVIVLTGHPKPDLREIALQAGANGFAEKPVNDTELLAMIDKLQPAAVRNA